MKLCIMDFCRNMGLFILTKEILNGKSHFFSVFELEVLPLRHSYFVMNVTGNGVCNTSQLNVKTLKK